MSKILMAGLILVAGAAPVLAGEGNGEPFPGPNAEVTTKVGAPTYAYKNQDPFQYYNTGTTMANAGSEHLANRPQDPFPFHVPGQAINMPAPVEGPQSGTVAAAPAPGTPDQIAQHAAPSPGTHG